MLKWTRPANFVMLTYLAMHLPQTAPPKCACVHVFSDKDTKEKEKEASLDIEEENAISPSQGYMD